MKVNWNICRNRGCEYYSNGFAGAECKKGLDYENIIKCQNKVMKKEI